METMEPLETPETVAHLFHIDVRTVRTKAHTGEWPAVSFGPRTLRFTPEQLATIVALHTITPAPAPVERRLGTRARRN